MTPAEVLNAIMDAIETRVATALGLTADDVYESRETGEATGPAVYVSATVPTVNPMGACNENASLSVTIGFHVPEDPDKPNRVLRMEKTMAIRDALVSRTDPIQYAGMCKVADFALSEPGDPDEGYIMGGLTLTCDAMLVRPS